MHLRSLQETRLHPVFVDCIRVFFPKRLGASLNCFVDIMCTEYSLYITHIRIDVVEAALVFSAVAASVTPLYLAVG